MRKLYYFVVLGTLLFVAGLVLLVQPTVLAQEATPEVPYLAEFYEAWVGSGHADATAEAFVHWDAEGEVPVECAQCHSTPGYLDYLGADGTEFRVVDNPSPLGTVVGCDTCHNNVTVSLTSVVFPSGAEITDAGDSARCMQCHQGRASGATVEAALEKAALPDLNTVSADLRFINIHYYAAAASLYGSVAGGGYQYAGQIYQMENEHVPGYDSCADCHNPHTLELKVEECQDCHEDVETAEDARFIRMSGSMVDYDGDGDMFEGIAEEIETLQETLYLTMQAYATQYSGVGLLYDEHSYPYFFNDNNANGEADADEINRENGFKGFTGNLLKAAYNYQVSLKDPGGFAHNPTYHIHLLFDSITALNVELTEPIDMAFAHRNDPGHFDVTAEAFRHWDEDGEVSGSCARCHSAEGLPTYLKNNVNIAVEPSNSLACSTCHSDLTDFTTYTVNEVTFPSGAKVSFGEEDENNLCLACHQGRESTTSVNTAINRAGVGDDEVTDKLTFRNIHYFAAGASLFGTEAKGAYEYADKAYNGRYQHGEDAPMTCTDCHYEHEPSIRVDDCADCHEDVETQEDVLLIRADAEGEEAVDYDGDGDVAEPIRDEIASFEDALLVAIQTYAKDTAGVAVAYNSHAHPYWFVDTNGNRAVDADEKDRYVTWTPTLLRAAYNYQYAQKDPGDFAHNPEYIMQVLFDSLEGVGGAEAVASFIRPDVAASEG